MNENLPIVGQHFAILRWSPLTLLMCKCQELQGVINLIQIFGFSNQTNCPKCGKGYIAKGLLPDGTIVVETVLPTPKASVM